MAFIWQSRGQGFKSPYLHQFFEVRTLGEWQEYLPLGSPVRVKLEISFLTVGITSVGDRSNRDRSFFIVDDVENSETAPSCRVRRL